MSTELQAPATTATPLSAPPSPTERMSLEQQKVLETLSSGLSIAFTARKYQITRATIYRWINKDPDFRALYNQWLQSVRHTCHMRLMAMADRATDALAEAVDRGNSKVATTVLRGLGMLTGKAGDEACDPVQVRREFAIRDLEKNVAISQREIDALKSPSVLHVRIKPPRITVDLFDLLREKRCTFIVNNAGDQPTFLINAASDSLAEHLRSLGYETNVADCDANSQAKDIKGDTISKQQVSQK